MPADVRAGAYTLARDGALRFAGERRGLRDCSPDEVLIWGFPVRGTLVSAGSVAARVATWRSIAGRNSGSLNALGARLRDAVLARGWWPVGRGHAPDRALPHDSPSHVDVLTDPVGAGPRAGSLG